jgi:pre-mRNA-splicing factor ISY1
MNQGPAYYGDLDEMNGQLLEFERAAEEEGISLPFVSVTHPHSCLALSLTSDWEEAFSNLREALDLPSDEPIPRIPRPPPLLTSTSPSAPSTAKRKDINDGDDGGGGGEKATDDGAASEQDTVKRPKTLASNMATAVANHDSNSTKVNDTTTSNRETVMQYARLAAAHMPFLDAESLLPPKMPTREEMEQALLQLQKKALVEEYFGNEN